MRKLWKKKRKMLHLFKKDDTIQSLYLIIQMKLSGKHGYQIEKEWNANRTTRENEINFIGGVFRGKRSCEKN